MLGLFSCTWCRLRALASNSGWVIVLFSLILIRPEAFTLVLLFNSYPLVKPEFQMVEEVLTLE